MHLALDRLDDFADAVAVAGDRSSGHVRIGVEETLASSMATTALLTGTVATASVLCGWLPPARMGGGVATSPRLRGSIPGRWPPPPPTIGC